MRNKVIAATLLSLLIFIDSVPAAAMDGCMRGMRPYGDYCNWMGGRGGYGALRPVKSAAEARRILTQFYLDEDVIIGPIKDRQLFFKADIQNTKGVVIDRVIVDKRSGRIRSIN